MKTHLIKKGITQDDIGLSAFFPYYPNDREQFQKKKANTIYQADIKRPRNPDFHNKVFAISRFVVGQEITAGGGFNPWYSKDPKLFIEACLLEFGFVDMYQTLSGEVRTRPSSISFGSMGQDRFEEFYRPYVEYTAELTGVSVQDIEDNAIYQA